MNSALSITDYNTVNFEINKLILMEIGSYCLVFFCLLKQKHLTRYCVIKSEIDLPETICLLHNVEFHHHRIGFIP